jgi:hypothetical protein
MYNTRSTSSSRTTSSTTTASTTSTTSTTSPTSTTSTIGTTGTTSTTSTTIPYGIKIVVLARALRGPCACPCALLARPCASLPFLARSLLSQIAMEVPYSELS